MPFKAKDGGDESNGDHLKEENAEHEDHRHKEGDRRSDLERPMPVEGRTCHRRQGKRRPQHRQELLVPVRGKVAEVADGHVGDRHQPQPAFDLRHS